MFHNTVILVLQETIEAALLVGVLLVLTNLFSKSWHRSFSLQTRWVAVSIGVGSIGAVIYSYYTSQISVMFDYVGQEVFNACIHLLSFILIFLLAFLVPNERLAQNAQQRSRLAAFCMTGIVVFAIVREGSEIIQYIGGIAGQGENFSRVLLGGSIGAGIGVSTGVILFYCLINLSVDWSFRACLILLCLIAGNMCSQVVLLLTQADWLLFTPIAWDSSSGLPENSIVGQLLFALVGYEATPSILQVVVYLIGITLIVVSPLFQRAWPQQRSLIGEVQND